MKTSNKVYGIIILFLFILVFTIVDLNYENREGFIFGGSNGWGGGGGGFKISLPKVRIPWVDPCNWACKQRKKREEERRKAAAALAKKKKDCINSGGKWHNSKCYKPKPIPKNIFKRNPSPPAPPPAPLFCDQDVDILKKKCNKINNKSSCDKKKCCKWCKPKGKCVSYSYVVLTNTVNTLEC